MDMDETHSRRAASKAGKWIETGGFPLSLIKDVTLAHALPPPACLFRSSAARTPSSSLARSTCVRQQQAQGLSQTVCLSYRCVHWQGALGSSSCSARAGTGDCTGGWRGGEAAASFSSVCSQHTWLKPAHWADILCFPPFFHSQLLAFASRGSL